MRVRKDTRSMSMVMKGYREYADDDEGRCGSCWEGNGDMPIPRIDRCLFSIFVRVCLM